MKGPKVYIEEIFADQHDIDEDTRIQLELINQTLAELQIHKILPAQGFSRSLQK